ncbi:putative RDD family membrane protein YckC [Symbiobacterium terraclitae]|uniref:RDD family membrane protein YckC n=1 Tax=Symbiobacterium terraclitae TaxID=557451 RepID=A0ABS4JSE5_9FIRM|nr:RDD family protein [Symbiobacterium terraclitae]MBP2017404.1 putative RDD family membrane protein YckC [Symbiobacterium terraclitae]
MDPIRIDTPESVDLSLEPAGLGSRFLAALIDALVQYGVIFALMLVTLPSFSIAAIFEEATAFATINFVLAILLVAVALLFFLYKLLLEALWNGQTLGKRAVGIRVVQANGMPVTFLQVVIRNLLRIIDYLPGYYLIGSICVLATRRRQRLGDLAAGTVVVRDRPAELPVVPDRLSHTPVTDLTRLREHVLRLREEDLLPARGYWQRRLQLDGPSRARVAAKVAEGLAARMSWTDPLPPYPDDFIEEVLYVRAH